MTEYRTNVLLGKLGLLYGAPSKDQNEAKAIFAEYARLMAGYSDAELDAGADRVIKGRRFKSWPTVGECIEALEAHRKDAHEKNAPERRTELPHPEWSKERIAEADRMIGCDLGRKAAREGWVLSLHDFCRNNRRLPKDREIPPLMEAARYVDHCAAGAIDMGMCRIALGELAHSMLAKRERLAKHVLGETP